MANHMLDADEVEIRRTWKCRVCKRVIQQLVRFSPVNRRLALSLPLDGPWACGHGGNENAMHVRPPLEEPAE